MILIPPAVDGAPYGVNNPIICRGRKDKGADAIDRRPQLAAALSDACRRLSRMFTSYRA
jgi:hypothetical protein